MSEIEDSVSEIAERAGWNDSTIIKLLCEFIGSRRLGASLNSFLSERASEEADLTEE